MTRPTGVGRGGSPQSKLALAAAATKGGRASGAARRAARDAQFASLSDLVRVAETYRGDPLVWVIRDVLKAARRPLRFGEIVHVTRRSEQRVHAALNALLRQGFVGSPPGESAWHLIRSGLPMVPGRGRPRTV